MAAGGAVAGWIGKRDERAGRLPADWQACYGVRPALAETCVEGARPGTSY